MILTERRTWLVIASASVLVAVPHGESFSRATRPTGVIAGVVVSAADGKTPIRRVVVTLNGGDVTNILAVTGDDGRFTFGSLAAGRYTLSAARPGFVTSSYGATRAGRTGTAIALAHGQQVTNLSFPITRGGVIAGVLTDESGEPARDVRVSAVAVVSSSAGGRRNFQGNSASATPTDDRGAFRIYGLPPGEYVVVAMMSRQGSGVPETSEADFQRAMQQVKSGGAVASAPSTIQTNVPFQMTGAAPVFFPGTFVGATARTIQLDPAEEVSGINFVVRAAPVGRVTGSIVGPDGQPAAGVPVRLSAVVRVPVIGLLIPAGVTSDREGRFTFTTVPPGPYTLSVQQPASPTGAPMLWGQTGLTTDGRDATASLTLRPGARISGSVVFESGAGQAPPAGVRVTMTYIPTEGDTNPFGAPQGVAMDNAGAFVFPGVTPGRYRVQATPPGAGWFSKSETLVQVADADLADVRITLTDRPIELSGTLQDAKGQPAPEYFVIAFPRNRALWSPRSPRVQHVRPGSDGAYLFRGLLAGEYLVGVATDVQAGDLDDPAFLQLLVPTSVPVTLVEADKKTLNVRVK